MVRAVESARFPDFGRRWRFVTECWFDIKSSSCWLSTSTASGRKNYCSPELVLRMVTFAQGLLTSVRRKKPPTTLGTGATFTIVVNMKIVDIAQVTEDQTGHDDLEFKTKALANEVNMDVENVALKLRS